MKFSHASVTTENASSYLTKLCQHWSHRFPVANDKAQGTIQLPHTKCTLRALPHSLEVWLESEDAEDQPRIEQVVAEHIERFGFKEQLVFDWQHGAPVTAEP